MGCDCARREIINDSLEATPGWARPIRRIKYTNSTFTVIKPDVTSAVQALLVYLESAE